MAAHLSTSSSVPTPVCTPFSNQYLEPNALGTSSAQNEARLRKVYDNLLGLANYGALKGPVVEDELALGLRAVGCETSSRIELAVFARTVERARSGQHVRFVDFLEDVQRAQVSAHGMAEPSVAAVAGKTSSGANGTPPASGRRASAPVPSIDFSRIPTDTLQVGGASSSRGSPRMAARRSTVGDEPQPYRSSVPAAGMQLHDRVITDLSLIGASGRSGRAVVKRHTILSDDSATSNSQDDSSNSDDTRANSATRRRHQARGKSPSAVRGSVSGASTTAARPGATSLADTVITIDDPQLSNDEQALVEEMRPANLPSPEASVVANAFLPRSASVSSRVKVALAQLSRLKDAVPAGQCRGACKELENILGAALQESLSLENRVQSAEVEIANSKELTESGLRQLREFVHSTEQQEADAATARSELAAARVELKQQSRRLAIAVAQRDWILTKRWDTLLQASAFRAWRLSAQLAVAKAAQDKHHQALCEKAAVAHCAVALRRRLRHARMNRSDTVAVCRSCGSTEMGDRASAGQVVTVA